MTTHTRLVRLVAIILDELRAAFVTAQPLGGRTREPLHAPGQFYAVDTYDFEACTGQPVVNVVRVYPAAGGTLEETVTANPCGGAWAVVVQIGIVRCTATLDAHGNVGSPADIENEALIVLDDAARLRAVWCNVIARADDDDIASAAVVEAYEPEGPAGGLIGGKQPARFLLA